MSRCLGLVALVVSAVLAGSLAGCTGPSGGEVYGGTAVWDAANSVYNVTLKGDFFVEDLYVVTGPPNDKVYMQAAQPVDGNLVFTANLLPSAYTFVVYNATKDVAIGEVNVSLPWHP